MQSVVEEEVVIVEGVLWCHSRAAAWPAVLVF